MTQSAKFVKYIDDIDSMDSAKVIGNRLFKIRYVTGFGGVDMQGRYAAQLLVDDKSYSHWETGHVMIPIQQAIRITEFVDGVTLDYIYRGRLDFVTPPLALALKRAPDRVAARPGRPRRV